jgi:glycosyltransferase involved in cell wall biosynthesis
VVSSHSEGFSLAAVEAMAAGLPVVATRCGGPETIVEHGVTGLLVPAGQPAELAHGLRRLSEDPVLRARLGSAARASAAERFTLARQVSRYQDLYLECLGEAPRTSQPAPEPRPVTAATRPGS